MAALGLGVCSGHLTVTPTATRPGTVPHRYWGVSVRAASRMMALSGAQGVLEESFDDPRTFLVLNDPVPPALASWRSSPTAIFTSLPDLAAGLPSAAASPAFSAVVYDLEGVSPPSEQRHVAASAERASTLVRRHHITFIGALGVDLVATIDPRPRSLPDYYRDFLDLDLVGEMAPFVDLLILQGQGLEDDPAAYADFIRTAAAQARAANPKVILVASLSTSPRGQLVPGQALLHAADATSSLVDGYWLNFGQLSPVCCDPREAQAMLAFLRLLESSHPG